MIGMIAAAFLAALALLTPAASDTDQIVVFQSYTLKKGIIVCKDRETVERMIVFLEAGDTEAYKNVGLQGFILGDCTAGHEGDVFYVDEAPFLADTIMVHRKGRAQPYWTIKALFRAAVR